MKKTPAHPDGTPEIEWEQGDFIEAFDYHDREYAADGESADGRKWIGTWYECDNEFVEILWIEQA